MSLPENIDAAYLGSVQVNALYIGTQLEYTGEPAESAPPLVETLLSKNPAGFWPFTDVSGAFQDTIDNNDAVGIDVDYQAAPGPDGESYPTVIQDTALLSIPDAAYMDITNGMTIVMTVNPVTSCVLFTKGFDVDYSKVEIFGQLYIQGLVISAIYSSVTGDLVVQQYSHGSAAVGQWNTFIVIFPSATDNMRVYFNKTVSATTSQTETGAGVYAHTDAPLIIGGIEGGSIGPTGTIGPVAIYPTALSDADCIAIMQSAIEHGWTPS